MFIHSSTCRLFSTFQPEWFYKTKLFTWSRGQKILKILTACQDKCYEAYYGLSCPIIAPALGFLFQSHSCRVTDLNVHQPHSNHSSPQTWRTLPVRIIFQILCDNSLDSSFSSYSKPIFLLQTLIPQSQVPIMRCYFFTQVYNQTIIAIWITDWSFQNVISGLLCLGK